jgi:CRISPR-associated protein Cas2
LIGTAATLQRITPKPGTPTFRIMPHRDLYLLAYDIVRDSRRARALEAVKAFGIGGQKSAHECMLSPGERNELWTRLAAIADIREDRLLLLRLDPRSEPTLIGRATPPVQPAMAYIG